MVFELHGYPYFSDSKWPELSSPASQPVSQPASLLPAWTPVSASHKPASLLSSPPKSPLPSTTGPPQDLLSSPLPCLAESCASYPVSSSSSWFFTGWCLFQCLLLLCCIRPLHIPRRGSNLSVSGGVPSSPSQTLRLRVSDCDLPQAFWLTVSDCDVPPDRLSQCLWRWIAPGCLPEGLCSVFLFLFILLIPSVFSTKAVTSIAPPLTHSAALKALSFLVVYYYECYEMAGLSRHIGWSVCDLGYSLGRATGSNLFQVI